MAQPAFFDDFLGPAGTLPDATKWKFWQGDHGNNELQYNNDQCAVLDGNGNLAITAKAVPFNGKAYQSSFIQTNGLYTFKYGLAEARIKMPKGRGLWPAFWMMGNDHDTPGVGWPKCGEIDISEVLCQDLETSYCTLHGATNTGGHWQSKAGIAAKVGGASIGRSWWDLGNTFHIYGCMWEAGRVRMLLDNIVVADFKVSDYDKFPGDAKWPFDHPFYLILNLAVGGWAGTPDAATVFPATMLVDWVRVTPQ